MPEEGVPRSCLECRQPIADTEKFLRVSSADGKQHFVHTICFTNATFDPDRYGSVTDPESGRQLR